MASRFWVGGTGTWDASDTTHWAASSGAAGGQSVPGVSDNVTIDASSGAGTVTVATDFNIISLTCGQMGMTLDFSANNNSPTLTGAITTSGSGTRTINWGSGTFTLSGNNFTIFANGTTTGQAMTGSATFNFTYSGSVGTRAFQFGGTGAGTFHTSTTCSVNITAGTDTVSFSGTNTGLPSLNFTGFSGTFSSTSTTISFATNLTMSSTMTNSVTAGLQWTANSSVGVITSNGKAFASAITFSGTGSTYTLAGAVSTTGAITLTAGTFNANNFNVTCGSFNQNNSNTRSFVLGTGTLTLTGTGNIINTSSGGTPLFSVASGVIAVTDTSSSTKTMVLATTGTTDIGEVRITPGGTGAVIFSNGSGKTIGTLTSTGPKTITFNAGQVYTITNLNLTGTAGNLVTLTSSTPGSQYTLSVASGTVNAYYVSLRDSLATGGASFRALNGVDVGNNTGWLFFSSRVQATGKRPLLTASPYFAAASTGASGSNIGISGASAMSMFAFFRTIATSTQTVIAMGASAGSSTGVTARITSATAMDMVISGVGTVPVSGLTTLTDSWHSVAVTKNASTGSYLIYVDGTSRNGGGGVTPNFTNATFKIGTDQDGGSHFLGNISFAGIWNVELSAADVLALHTSFTLPSTQAKALYKMTESAGSVLVDSSGTGNNGVLTAAGWVIGLSPYGARKQVNANLVKNGDFESAPPFTAATNTAARWIDGTAAGSTTNDVFQWAIGLINGSASARFDPSVFKNGASSLKLSTLATASQILADNFPSVTVDSLSKYCIRVQPSTDYTGTFWMKTNYVSGDSSDGASVNFLTRNAAGTGLVNNVSSKIKTTLDWTQYTVTFTTGSTAVFLSVKPQVVGNTGTATLIMDAWFDDLSLTPVYPEGRVPANGNLVKNFDFEVAPTFVAATTTGNRFIDGSSGGSATNSTYKWSIISGSTAGTVAAQFDSSTANSGVNSMKISTQATGSTIEVSPLVSNTVANLALYAIPALPNTAYTCSFAMRTAYVSGDSNDGAYVDFTERNAAAGNAASNISTKVKTTLGWTLYTVSFTTTASTVAIGPRLVVKGNTGTATLIMDAWFDDIYLAPTTNPGRILIT